MRKRIVRKGSKVKQLPSAVQEYVASVHRAVHAFALFFEATLEGELTQAESIVLLYLANSPMSTINEVHKGFLHKRSTLTNVIDRLEARGFVRRRISESDRRNFVLELTRSGDAAARKVVAAIGILSERLEVTPSSIAAAVQVLERTVETSLSIAGHG